jgi:hypothetical protein
MIFASTIVAVFTCAECRSAHRGPSQVVARQSSSKVCGAVAKHDAPTGFMLAEKATASRSAWTKSARSSRNIKYVYSLDGEHRQILHFGFTGSSTRP